MSEVIILGMSETLKAISDPVRREILELLKDGRKTAAARYRLRKDRRTET